MRRLRLLGLVVALELAAARGSPAVAAAQDFKTQTKAVETALKGRPLGLRDFSDDAVTRFQWDGGKLVAAPVEFHALSVFTTNSIKLNIKLGRGTITLTGRKAAITVGQQFGDANAADAGPMRIEVDLNGADPAAVLNGLQDSLFFPDAAAELAGLPERMVHAVKLAADASNCTCVWIEEGGVWSKVDPKGGDITPPKLIHMVEPEFSEEARRRKRSGNVMVSLYVSGQRRGAECLVAPGCGRRVG